MNRATERDGAGKSLRKKESERCMKDSREGGGVERWMVCEGGEGGDPGH